MKNTHPIPSSSFEDIKSDEIVSWSSQLWEGFCKKRFEEEKFDVYSFYREPTDSTWKDLFLEEVLKHMYCWYDDVYGICNENGSWRRFEIMAIKGFVDIQVSLSPDKYATTIPKEDPFFSLTQLLVNILIDYVSVYAIETLHKDNDSSMSSWEGCATTRLNRSILKSIDMLPKEKEEFMVAINQAVNCANTTQQSQLTQSFEPFVKKERDLFTEKNTIPDVWCDIWNAIFIIRAFAEKHTQPFDDNEAVPLNQETDECYISLF